MDISSTTMNIVRIKTVHKTTEKSEECVCDLENVTYPEESNSY